MREPIINLSLPYIDPSRILHIQREMKKNGIALEEKNGAWVFTFPEGTTIEDKVPQGSIHRKKITLPSGYFMIYEGGIKASNGVVIRHPCILIDPE